LVVKNSRNIWYILSLLLEKIVLRITSVLASSRRIQARLKNSVKVIVKFIKKGIRFQKMKAGCLYSENNHFWRERRETFPVPHTGNGSKNSKWWFLTSNFILESWGNTLGQR
jgi:hypothetical protein